MDELKKVLLAGIGLTAMTYDKAEKFVKELMDKGRLTLDEGKELQSELKRKSQAEAEGLLGQITMGQIQFLAMFLDHKGIW